LEDSRLKLCGMCVTLHPVDQFAPHQLERPPAERICRRRHPWGVAVPRKLDRWAPPLLGCMCLELAARDNRTRISWLKETTGDQELLPPCTC
jgi:hypothetical protein